MLAIAAMSRNRVIGRGDAIPWRIREEFQWFRRMTYGGVVIMGRKTFESLPKPLEGRVTVVLTRDPDRLKADPRTRERYAGAVVGAAALRPPDASAPGQPATPPTEVRLVGDLDALARAGLTRRAWLCGGAELYRQLLPDCSELYLSVIDRDVEGDAFFPPFEHLFELAGVAAEFAEFKVLHYLRNDRTVPSP